MALLNGLDGGAADGDEEAVRGAVTGADGAASAAAGHSDFVTGGELGLDFSSVKLWPASEAEPGAPPRASLVRAAVGVLGGSGRLGTGRRRSSLRPEVGGRSKKGSAVTFASDPNYASIDSRLDRGLSSEDHRGGGSGLPGPPPRASMVAQSTRPLDGVESDMPGRYEAKPPPRAADIAAAVRALG